MSHTRGKWQWIQIGGNLVLAAMHHGTLIVMDFVRKGMNSAQPRFAIREENQGGLLKKANEIDIANHPDACLIAAAPDLLEACETFKKLEDIKEKQNLIIDKRKEGLVGIQVSNDELATEYQRLYMERQTLKPTVKRLIIAAIAKAKQVRE